ncbi:MAG: Rpn family recombination-promoting nuclease/putative transposase [Janthinobacterium lividum]
MNDFSAAESPYISMLSDYGFKATFGNQHHTLFLRRALQALIGSPVPIEEVTFEQTTFEGPTAGSRSGLYDLACTDAEGTYFLVEMQVSRFPQFLQRMKFYAFTKYNTLMRRGNFLFEQLPRIYSIGILQHGIFPTVSGYHQHLNLRNEQGEILDQQLHFVTIELDKFNEHAPITTDLEKLLYLMKTLHKLPSADAPLFYHEQWIKEAIEELDRSALTAEQRMLLEWDIVREVSAVQERKADLAEAREIALREGKAEGIAAGKAEGKAEGIAAGKAEGKAEGEQEVIRLMLRNSALSTEEVARYTGRTVAYIEKIKAQL